MVGLWLAFTLEFLVRKSMMAFIMDINKDRFEKIPPLYILAIISVLVAVVVFMV